MGIRRLVFRDSTPYIKVQTPAKCLSYVHRSLGLRDFTTAAADVVEGHARVRGSLLRLEEDSLVLAARALLLDAR
jgi:hypothetical protein